jgi:hypothetical protein
MTIKQNRSRTIPSDLQKFDMTFTITGLTILKAYRDRMSCEESRTITLAKALDSLLKTHPVAAETNK